jgi:hypothetical protein
MCALRIYNLKICAVDTMFTRVFSGMIRIFSVLCSKRYGMRHIIYVRITRCLCFLKTVRRILHSDVIMWRYTLLLSFLFSFVGCHVCVKSCGYLCWYTNMKNPI